MLILRTAYFAALVVCLCCAHVPPSELLFETGQRLLRSRRKSSFHALSNAQQPQPALLGTPAMRLRGGSGSRSEIEKEKVCVIGSGNWGCAIARVMALNTATLGRFDPTVRMWVYEEEVEGRNLTDIINTDHENPKYLPGITLPPNIVAISDLAAAVADATVLVWVLPHQFLGRLLPTVKSAMRKDAISVSLIKGMAADENGRLLLISSLLSRELDVPQVAVLMGANVADQVARDQFCEATLGTSDANAAEVLLSLFDRPTFRVRAVADVAGVEVCGALKNVVALGAGFADGLGLGSNTKAAIMRIGLVEMMKFAKAFYPAVEDKTIWESCGVADLMTTCLDGRNRRCAQRFVSASLENKGWRDIETELLAGQRLQGPETAEHIHRMLVQEGRTQEFPLLETIYGISCRVLPPSALVDNASNYY